MAKTNTSIPRFTGSSIGPEISKAIDALPADAEIVTFEAGENMPILCAFLPDGEFDGVGIDEYAWDGENWHVTGRIL